VSLALAKAVESAPTEAALPGSSRYEPKWTGRTTAFIDVPPAVVLDGEAVIWSRDRLDFDALQQRMSTSRARCLSNGCLQLSTTPKPPRPKPGRDGGGTVTLMAEDVPVSLRSRGGEDAGRHRWQRKDYRLPWGKGCPVEGLVLGG